MASPILSPKGLPPLHARPHVDTPELPSLRAEHHKSLERLLKDKGQKVVAFVGAGFLAPLGETFGSWKGLLNRMITDMAAKEVVTARKEGLERAKSLLEVAWASAELQRVAQVIEDTIGADEMNELASKLLELPKEIYDEDAHPEEGLKRVIDKIGESAAAGPKVGGSGGSQADDDVDPATGRSALHRACLARNEKLALVLIESGVNVTLKDKFERTASDYCGGEFDPIVIMRKRIAMLRLLPVRAIITTNFTLFHSDPDVVVKEPPTSSSPSDNIIRKSGGTKVFSLRESFKPDEQQAKLVYTLEHPSTRQALRNLLREDDDADNNVISVSYQDRLIKYKKLLSAFEKGTAPPFWDALDPPVFHAHGTLYDPVFTKISYRELLHDGPTFMASTPQFATADWPQTQPRPNPRHLRDLCPSQPFMRSLVTSKTLLFLGFSFTDEYLEELRSQCLALLVGSGPKGKGSEGKERRTLDQPYVHVRTATATAARPQPAGVPVFRAGTGARAAWGGHDGSNTPNMPGTAFRPRSDASILPLPLGFAVMDRPRKKDSEKPLEPDEKTLLEYYRKNEGLAYLLYESKPIKGGQRDFSGFDVLMKGLVEKTSIPCRLREKLSSKHLLFFDRPAPSNFSLLAKDLCDLMWLDDKAGKMTEQQLQDYETAVSNRKKYKTAFDSARKQAKEDRDEGKSSGKTTFVVPMGRESETWPLPGDGSMQV